MDKQRLIREEGQAQQRNASQSVTQKCRSLVAAGGSKTRARVWIQSRARPPNSLPCTAESQAASGVFQLRQRGYAMRDVSSPLRAASFSLSTNMPQSTPGPRTSNIISEIEVLMHQDRASPGPANLLVQVLRWISYRGQLWDQESHGFAQEWMFKCEQQEELLGFELQRVGPRTSSGEIDSRFRHYHRTIAGHLVRDK